MTLSGSRVDLRATACRASSIISSSESGMLTVPSLRSRFVRDRFLGDGDFNCSRRLLLPSEGDDDGNHSAPVDALSAA